METEIRPEPETERGMFTSGCSLFTQFSVPTVGLEQSEPLYFILDNPEMGLNVLNTRIVLFCLDVYVF